MGSVTQTRRITPQRPTGRGFQDGSTVLPTLSSPSPECFPADIPGHSFLFSEDLLDLEPPAALALGGRCDSFADPFAAAALPAVKRKTKASVSVCLFARF